MLTPSRRHVVFDSIAEISRIATLPDVSAAFAQAVERFGFHALGINGLPPVAGDADPLILTEKAPDGFRAFYVEERFYLVDHICAHARTASAPFRYRDAPFDQAQSARHERFIQGLRSFAMGEGLVVPVGLFPAVPSCVWLAGEDPDLDDESVLAIQLLALFSAGRANALSNRRRPPQPTSRLTSREREALQWISAGKTSWEISTILGVSERVINKFIAEAMVKLGAVTRAQAVVIAIQNGDVEL